MSRISRRQLVTRGLTGVAGGLGLGVAGHLAARHGLIPPDSGGIYGIGETLNYSSHRLLMAGGSMAREFSPSHISPNPRINGKPPANDTFRSLLAGEFASWRLSIDGMVARPASLSLAQLKAFPASTQITHLACEEGWSYIAQWTGVPLSYVLNLTGVSPQARYAVYFSIDEGWWDSIDMPEALHPQTLVTYGMNGGDLPIGHGAPVRLRVPRQLGYKSVKHLARITLTDDLKQFGKGLGSAPPEFGFAWYAGI